MAKKKEDKAKQAEKKARREAKQSKKADKKDTKKKSRTAGGGGDSDDDADADLDAILQEYARQQEQFLKITEVPCDPPSARSSATLVAAPDTKELFLFGGEHYNGALVTFFNELYVYLVNKGIWRRVTSPNSPLPRSGHAMCRGTNGIIYVSMGEFSSPKQGTFHHYNDLWALDPASREWTRLEPRGKTPPARSGHRMVAFRDYIVLFGGFQDTSQQTKYLQDLWIYDIRGFVWHNPLPTQKPDARSSFTLLPHEAGAALFGGYSRVKATTKVGNQSKGGAQAVKNVLRPVVHQDSWLLRVKPPEKEAPAKTPPTATWERRKRPVNLPNPPRAGATMVWHKGRGIQFGGVHDVEASEEGIDSEFFDTLYAWNVDRNRFFPLTLRRPRAAPKKAQHQDRAGGRRGRGKADEEELLKNLAALNAGTSVEDAGAINTKSEKGSGDATVESDESDSEDEDPLRDQPVTMEMPHPRFNGQLAVFGDTLYIYGGTYEAGDREFTFDDMYAIDLVKLDGVRQIFQRDLEDWVASDEEEEEDDEEGDDEEDEEEEDEEGDDLATQASDIFSVAGTADTPSTPTARSVTSTARNAKGDVEDQDEDEGEEEPRVSGRSDDDGRPHPRPFESLRDFFARTSSAWQEALLRQTSAGADSSLPATAGAEASTITPVVASGGGRTVKELRKAAFALAEDQWWDCREEITALEDQQEQAGIGEIVSLADRGDAGAAGGGGAGAAPGGAGRRR